MYKNTHFKTGHTLNKFPITKSDLIYKIQYIVNFHPLQQQNYSFIRNRYTLKSFTNFLKMRSSILIVFPATKH